MGDCFVFIDESGDLGEKGSRYLVLAALIVPDHAALERIIKNMRRYKFKKQLRKANEIKADHSSEEVIGHMLSKLNEVPGAKVFYMVLEKKKTSSEFLKEDKHKLYNYVAGKLARNLPVEKGRVEIRIDKSKGKPLLQEDFNQYFLRNLNHSERQLDVILHHSYSHNFSGLQFADVLAWSCFQKFEHANSQFVDVLKIEQEVYHVW